MANYGTKASKSGNEVLTAADKNLVFTSKSISPKVNLDGTLTFTATPQTKTVNHGLSYIPQVLLFVKASGTSYWTFLATGNFVDSTKLSVTRNNGDKVRYWILYNPLEAAFSGNVPSGDNYGVKVSDAGNNVLTADIEDLDFTSALQSIMIENTYNKTVEVSTNDGTVYTETQAHGLSYTPAFITTVKFDIGGTDYNFPYEFISPPEAFYTYVDGTNITFSGEMRSYAAPLDVFFRIHILNLDIE